MANFKKHSLHSTPSNCIVETMKQGIGIAFLHSNETSIIENLKHSTTKKVENFYREFIKISLLLSNYLLDVLPVIEVAFALLVKRRVCSYFPFLVV